MSACDLCGTRFGRMPADGVDCHMCNWPAAMLRAVRPCVPSHERPLDVLLERLRAHGLPYAPGAAHQTWTGACPICNLTALRLSERRDDLEPDDAGCVSVICSNGCAPDRIIRAIGMPTVIEEAAA